MKEKFYEKYFDWQTNVYNIVDKDFLLGFNEKQAAFMLMTYYVYYKSYCESTGNKVLPMNTVLLNARRRKIKLIQQCCPYCGCIDIMVNEGKVHDIMNLKYCSRCGKKSTKEIAFEQISSLIRMEMIHHAGITKLISEEEMDQEIIGYDIMLTEIVQLTSIFEKIIRDFYIDLVCIKYKCYSSDYLIGVIEKDLKNDFMNFDKANNHYKKALDMNLKEMVSAECRENLLDLVNVRNVVVHNNGRIDEKFKKTSTFDRLINYIEDDLIFVTSDLVQMYLQETLDLIDKIEDEYNKRFSENKFNMISNYYFNDNEANDNFHFEKYITECGSEMIIKRID